MDYEEFLEVIESQKKSILRIQGGVLEYKSTTYPLRNISHITLVEKSVLEGKSGLLILLLALLGQGMILLGLLTMLMACTEGEGGAGIASIIILIIGGWLSSLPKEENHIFYGLAIETNSGSNELFFSEDKNFIEEVKIILSNALAKTDSINYTIHIGDKNLIDNSITHITHEHYKINIEQHNGLSDEDKKFLLTDFSKSIENIYREIVNIKDSQVTKNELDKIVKEINSEKPDVGKIKQSYEKIKTVTDGYETVTSLIEFGNAISRTIMMFIN